MPGLLYEESGKPPSGFDLFVQGLVSRKSQVFYRDLHRLFLKQPLNTLRLPYTKEEAGLVRRLEGEDYLFTVRRLWPLLAEVQRHEGWAHEKNGLVAEVRPVRYWDVFPATSMKIVHQLMEKLFHVENVARNLLPHTAHFDRIHRGVVLLARDLGSMELAGADPTKEEVWVPLMNLIKVNQVDRDLGTDHIRPRKKVHPAEHLTRGLAE